jgi:hypothetical protein
VDLYELTFQRNVSSPSSASKIGEIRPSHLVSASFLFGWFSIPKMEATHSSETSVHMRTTEHYNLEYGNIQLRILSRWIKEHGFLLANQWPLGPPDCQYRALVMISNAPGGGHTDRLATLQTIGHALPSLIVFVAQGHDFGVDEHATRNSATSVLCLASGCRPAAGLS